jgi:hypothetical protein
LNIGNDTTRKISFGRGAIGVPPLQGAEIQGVGPLTPGLASYA